MKQNYPPDSEDAGQECSNNRLFHDLCFLCPHLAYSTLHLHWWWCSHEHVVPRPPGSEEP